VDDVYVRGADRPSTGARLLRRLPRLPQPSSTKVPMRLIRLAVVLPFSVCIKDRVVRVQEIARELGVRYLLARRADRVRGLSAPLSGGHGGCRTSAGCRRRPPRRSPTGTRTLSPLCRRRRHAPESGIRTTTRREFAGSGRHQAHNRDSRRGRHTECPGGSPSPIYGEDQHRHSFLTPVPIIQ
jgi:hypothetical protein